MSSKRVVLFTKDGLPVEVPEDLLLGGFGQITVQDSTRSRSAWRQRARLLSLHGRSPSAIRFLQLAVEHDHESFNASEAANALHISISTLGRLASESFGYPPGIMLGLARACSLGNQIGEAETPLKEVARQHSFPGPSEMGRFFARYSGEPPGLYRSRFRLRLWATLHKE